MTEINNVNLLARGYREYPPSKISEGEKRFFQKCFSDDKGKRFFLEFREWNIPQQLEPWLTAGICCETDTNGYLWATFRESSIEEAEARAEALWRAVGAIYYARS